MNPSNAPVPVEGVTVHPYGESPGDVQPGMHAQTIVRLVIILEALVKKVQEIRAGDGRPHHTAVAGHLRSALDYERKVLADLSDPKGMMALTHQALGNLLLERPQDAIRLLEDSQ